MAAQDLLRNRVSDTPMIYAYKHVGVPAHERMLKVGYTTREVETRVREQNLTGNIPYEIVLKRPAMRKDGSSFTDKLVHRILRKNHIQNPEGEWFVCDVKTVEKAIASAAEGKILSFDELLPEYMRLSEAEQRLREGTLSDKIRKAVKL